MFDCIQADGQFIVTKAWELESCPCILTCTSWSKWRPKLRSWYHFLLSTIVNLLIQYHKSPSRFTSAPKFLHWTLNTSNDAISVLKPLETRRRCLRVWKSHAWKMLNFKGSKWHAFGARSWWQTKDSCPPHWPCSFLPILSCCKFRMFIQKRDRNYIHYIMCTSHSI